jgi:hypothetical protein
MRFSPGFPPGAGEYFFFCEFSGAPAVIITTLEQPQLTFTDLFRAGFPGEHFLCGFLGAQALIRTSLEQIPLWEILLLDAHG